MPIDGMPSTVAAASGPVGPEAGIFIAGPRTLSTVRMTCWAIGMSIRVPCDAPQGAVISSIPANVHPALCVRSKDPSLAPYQGVGRRDCHPLRGRHHRARRLFLSRVTAESYRRRNVVWKRSVLATPPPQRSIDPRAYQALRRPQVPSPGV
jgi:hypothetical protein